MTYLSTCLTSAPLDLVHFPGMIDMTEFAELLINLAALFHQTADRFLSKAF